jgi:hypothetical protein
LDPGGTLLFLDRGALPSRLAVDQGLATMPRSSAVSGSSGRILVLAATPLAVLIVPSCRERRVVLYGRDPPVPGDELAQRQVGTNVGRYRYSSPDRLEAVVAWFEEPAVLGQIRVGA